MGIVELALLFIAKDFVGLGYGLELDLGFGALVLGDFVGVVEECELRKASVCQPKGGRQGRRLALR